MTVAVAGTHMTPDGTTALINGTMDVTEWVRADGSPDPGRYVPTKTWYPARWEFSFSEGVPDHLREFVMTPIVSEAQSGFFANGAQYCEGAVVIVGPDGSERGRGFAESVSYADTRATTHRLAGLDDSPASVRALAAREPNRVEQFFNALYVLTHRRDLRKIVNESAGLDFFA